MIKPGGMLYCLTSEDRARSGGLRHVLNSQRHETSNVRLGAHVKILLSRDLSNLTETLTQGG